MQVKEIMTPHAEYIDPNTTVMEAAMKMKNLNIGSLPVGERDRLVGMVTDRDITVLAAADGKDPRSTKIGDIMSRGVTYCFEDDDIETAGQLMSDKQIRRLVVLNHDKRMVGIVSVGDFLESHDTSLIGEMVSRISVPLHKAETV